MADLKALFHELIRFETELYNGIGARLRADCDLPIGQFETMQIIARHTPCRVFDIADELAITVGGTSKVVDRIEAAGHCLRRPNPDDRRSSIVELTQAGRQALAGATAVFEEELELRFAAAVSADALHQLSLALTELRSAGRAISQTRRTAQ